MHIETYGIQLGDTVKDRVTGFEGVVTSVAQYQTGCARVGVQRRDLLEGKLVDPVYFDCTMLDKVSAEAVLPRVVEPAPAVYAGGPQPAPNRGR